MASSGQKENISDNRATASVNGQRVPRAPKQRGGDRLHYNPDIQWLLNDSRGELGEQGQSIDPAGGGSGNPADNWPAIERMHRALFAVAKWRRLNAVMSRLSPETQVLLRERYKVTEREHSEVMGLRAAFGDLATLAWHLCDDHEDMRRKLSSGKKSGDKSITVLRNRATVANRKAHGEWLDAERTNAKEWAEG